MPLFERHVFICCNDRPGGHVRGCCRARGGDAVRDEFKKQIAQQGLRGSVRSNLAGCLDQCEHGPVVVVYPEQVWYGGVTPADVAEIVERHLKGGLPVERLRMADGCVNNPQCPHRRSE